MSDNEKQNRIRQELAAAGVTRYGKLKAEVGLLPQLIRDNEHIKGAIYGTIDGSSAMLLATTHRMLFIDVRPMHASTDEVSYSVVGDIHVDFGMMYCKVTIYTPAKAFSFNYVNQKCARIFINVLEEQVLNLKTLKANPKKPTSKKSALPIALPGSESVSLATDDTLNFLQRHNQAVISTYGHDGYPYGATVFYFASSDSNDIHIITRESTPTATNSRKKPKVGLTVTDVDSLTTMHIAGVAQRESDISIAHSLLNRLNDSKLLKNTEILPVNQIEQGGYLVLRVAVHSIYLHQYRMS